MQAFKTHGYFPSTPARRPPYRICLLALLCCTAGACGDMETGGNRAGEGGAGSFIYFETTHSFLDERDSMRLKNRRKAVPEVGAFCTNFHRKVDGGNRRCIIDRRDFVLEITADPVPAGGVFTAAFGIPFNSNQPKRKIAAEYWIAVDGKEKVNRKFTTFQRPQNRRWHEVRVDLREAAGNEAVIELGCRVIPASGEVPRGWAEPRILVPREVPWREASREAPNVVLLLVDTLRADRLGCYGYARPTSPRLDRFAARSLLFEEIAAPASWTWPSTASVLTGQYPLHHGVLDSGRCTLPLDRRTLPEFCAEAGMRTAAFSANRLISPSRFFDQGFITFEEMYMQDAAEMVDAFSDWLADAKKGRFFAYLHFIDPHDPYDPPEETLAKLGVTTPPGGCSEEEIRELKRGLETFERELTAEDREAVSRSGDLYDGEVLFWDEQFGRLLDLLEAEGLMDRTVIAVTSDHGEEFLEHGFFGHGTNLFDESIRVPLILHGPGVEPGREREQAELVSLAPTLLDLAGIPYDPDAFDAHALPLVAGGGRRDAPAFSHTESGAAKRMKGRSAVYAVRTNRWKYISHPEAGLFLLFDIEGDPGETRNLAGEPEYAALRDKLDGQLGRWIARFGALAPDVKPMVDQETLEALRQLGYMGR